MCMYREILGGVNPHLSILHLLDQWRTDCDRNQKPHPLAQVARE